MVRTFGLFQGHWAVTVFLETLCFLIYIHQQHGTEDGYAVLCLLQLPKYSSKRQKKAVEISSFIILASDLVITGISL